MHNMQVISMVTVKGYKSSATVLYKRNTGIQDDSEYMKKSKRFSLSQSLAQHPGKRGFLLGERAAPWRKRAATFWKKAAPQEKKAALFAPAGWPRIWQTRLNVKSMHFVLNSC